MPVSARLVPLLALAAFFLASCGDDPITPITGTLKGKVFLYQNSGAMIADASGVTVSVDGTSFSTQTAPDGSWQIDNLPTGTYVLHMRKEGFGEYVVSDLRFLGNGVSYVPIARIAALPTFSVTDLTVKCYVSGDNVEVTVEGSIDQPSPRIDGSNDPDMQVGVNVYADRDSLVSNDIGRYVRTARIGLMIQGLIVPGTGTKFSRRIDFKLNDLMPYADSTGTIYFAAYPGGLHTLYTDPFTNSITEARLPDRYRKLVVVKLW